MTAPTLRLTGENLNATYADLADDAIAAIQFLKTKDDVDPRDIGIYGHSQGGTIAPLIATRSTDVAFIIAAAAVGVPVYPSPTTTASPSISSTSASSA